MDQLSALILRFKEYNGSVAANFEILAPYFEDEHNMSDDLTSTFDFMSYHLCKTYIRLSQATVYGTLARQLFVAISEVDRIISDPNHEIADMKMFLKLVRKISTIADKLYKELKKPSLFTVKIGGRSKKITFLPRIPLSVFFRALTGLKVIDNVQEPSKASFLRRLALISMSGGICHNLLDKRELLGFEFRPENFERLDLKFALRSIDQFDDIFRQALVIVNRYTSNFECCQNEATLRSFLWDQILSVLITKVVTAPRKAISEFHATKLLKIDSSTIADMAILTKQVYNATTSSQAPLEFPILFIEIGTTSIDRSLRHKDFVKLCGLMTSACARQAEKLQSMGRDPMMARAFGILIGGSRFQLVIAHPVLDSKLGSFDECYVSISAKETWLFDLFKPLGSPVGQTFFVHGENQMIQPSQSIDEDLLVKSNSTNQEMIQDLNLEEPIENELYLNANANQADILNVNPDFSAPNSDRIELNRVSYENLAIFFEHFNEYLLQIQSIPTAMTSSPGDPTRKVRFQTDSFVATSYETSTGITPNSKQFISDVQNYVAGTDDDLDRSPTPRQPKRAMIRKPCNYEYELYTRHFRNGPSFPLVYQSKVVKNSDLDGNGFVEYTFEWMEPLLDGGVFDIFSGSKGGCFSSIVRADSFENLLLEATTFALHTLYGLFQLHEQLQVVHCDISPENVMFSHMDDCWKLNDFGASLKLEDSLNNARKVGTENFIAPESSRTGLFTKESDIYSLGSVLFLTFHLRLMFFLEMGDSDDEDSRRLERSRTPDANEFETENYSEHSKRKAHYVEFVTLVQKMIKSRPELRPCALDALKDFLNFFEKIQEKDFVVYGSKKIIPLIRELQNSNENETDEIPFRSII